MKWLIVPALGVCGLLLCGCEVNVKEQPPNVNVVKPPDVNVVTPPAAPNVNVQVNPKK
jgi:hypothetical protein